MPALHQPGAQRLAPSILKSRQGTVLGGKKHVPKVPCPGQALLAQRPLSGGRHFGRFATNCARLCELCDCGQCRSRHLWSAAVGVQVVVPMEGARLLIASDGVWDAFDKTSRVTAIQRSQATQVAAREK